MTRRTPRPAGPTTTSICECGHVDHRHYDPTHARDCCPHFVAWNSGRGKIRKAARANGWTVHRSLTWDEYRRGARYIRVSYNVRDSVREAVRQTGSVGGRHIDGRGKAEHIVRLLTLDRWSDTD